MKIKKNIITMLGIVAIAGMCMVGCSNSSADGSSTKTETQSTSVASASQENSTKDYIGEDKAKEIMQKEVPEGAEFVNFQLDEYKDDNTAEYEGELVKDDTEYDITVDAVTGEVLESEQEKYDGRYENNTSKANDSSEQYITREKAKQIMKKEVLDAKIVALEFDKNDDDNEPATYEGELVKDNTEYDVTVDAITGEVLHVEKEAIK